MGAFHVGKTAHRVVATTLIVGAGAAAQITGHDNGLWQALVAVAGLGGNILASDIYKRCTSNAGIPRDALRNGDLAEAVGKAWGAILRRYAEPLPRNAQCDALLAMADAVPARWRKLSASHDPALAELAEIHLPRLLSHTADQIGTISTLDPDTWRQLMGWLDDKNSLTPGTVNAIADELHTGFAKALFEILKHDFADGGKAFPAITIMLLGENNAILRGLDAKMDALIEIVQARPATLADQPPSGRHEIPAKNPRFTGRETLLQTLHAMLSQRTPVALVGIPGVGKTDTAARYVHEYFPAPAAAHWVNADTPDDLALGFSDIARRLKLPLPADSDGAQVRAAVKAHLSQNDGWLVVFNNVEHAALTAEYFPPAANGQILLTTRPGDTAALAEPLEIPPMDAGEGANLLLARARWIKNSDAADTNGLSHRQNAQTLSEILGGLPLALDQAGAYMESKGKTPFQFANLYAKRSRELLRERGNDPSRHADSVHVTFSLAFGQVETVNPAAADLLRACAFLAPDAIPAELFQTGGPAFGDTLAALADDEYDWDNAVEAAARLALLRHDPTTRTLSMHRLAQIVLQNAMTDEVRRDWTERIVRAVNKAFPDSEYSAWETCERLLPHAFLCRDWIESNALATAEAAHLLNRIAEYLHDQARYAEAEPVFVRALEIRETALPTNHPDAAESLNNLGLFYDSQSRCAEAEPLLIRALEIREKTLGSEHHAVAESLNNLAGQYRSQGRYAEAEPLFVRALKIFEKARGQEHPHTAISLSNLALLYTNQGRYADAEPVQQRAWKIWEKALGPHHPKTALGLNNLAVTYYLQSRYTEAEPLLLRAKEIREKSLPSGHSDIGESLHNLAGLYQKQGRYAEAEPLLVQALEIREKTLGPEHPDTVRSLKKYAKLLKAMGRGEEAAQITARFPAWQTDLDAERTNQDAAPATATPP